MKLHGYTRNHLVQHHGYSETYAAVAPLDKLIEEHDRLHADETAEHLDHQS